VNEQFWFKATIPSPLSLTKRPSSKSFGRCYVGGIGFIYLSRKSGCLLNKQLGSRPHMAFPSGLSQ